MDDQTAFERQLSGEISGLMGPIRPVDDRAVFDAVIAAAESPKWRFWSTSMPSVGGSYVRVTGRTQTVFSPVKAIVAGALVFALGGLFLIVQPFEQQVNVPGAAYLSEIPEDAIVVTATQQCASNVGWTDGAPTFSCTLTASDPRVTGPLTMTTLYDISTPNDAGAGITAYEVTLQGPDGTWAGRLYIAWDVPDGGPWDAMMVLAGDGTYAGWNYVTAGDISGARPFDHETVGTLYPGSPPPPWEMPATSE